jgi:hypothetical protein
MHEYRRLTSADFVGPSKPSGTQVCYQHCPVCGASNWKTYMDPLTGKYFCFAGQHSAGGIVDVGMQFNPMAALRDKLTNREAIVSWPPAEMPDSYPFGHRARTYLEQRGLDPDACAAYGWAEHRTEERILVPYPGPAGTWIYWNTRAYASGVTPKYSAMPGRHPLYVLPRWHPSRRVVLVEGVFDAMAVHQHAGLAAIALGGKSLPAYLRPDLLYLAADQILVALDGDAIGAGLSLVRQLSHLRDVRFVEIASGEDPASMGPALKEHLSEYTRDSE